MFDVKHFVNEAVKFVLAFFQHSKAAEKVLRDGTRVVFIIVFAYGRLLTFVAIHACKKVPTPITNIATCITQVTLKLVHYALLINHLWFRLTFMEVLANFRTHKYGLDFGMELKTSQNSS